nr:type II toxin-antitoxin system RelE/ParE family toxin [Frankia sp. AgB32]
MGWVDALDARSKALDRHAGFKEFRPGSAGSSEIRVIFVFDPWRSAILLVGGDKSGNGKPRRADHDQVSQMGRCPRWPSRRRRRRGCAGRGPQAQPGIH